MKSISCTFTLGKSNQFVIKLNLSLIALYYFVTLSLQTAGFQTLKHTVYNKIPHYEVASY